MGAISTATLSGVLLLDKGSGMTSNSALQRARKLLDMRKAGHTGSLDPLASGILPLCFNEATKLSSYLLDSDKRYRVLARLGVTTDTGDADGEVRSRTPVPALDEPALLTVLAGFTGPILQVPPMFSALKHRGKRLYELARKGVEVERPPRPVTVFDIELAGRGADYLELDVHCSKGTYIRTLVEDIGHALGCGAHVEVLRRTTVAGFSVAQAVTLEQLEAMAPADRLDCLRPMDSMVQHWPAAWLDAGTARLFRHGQAVEGGDFPVGELVRVYGGGGVFLGIGCSDGKGRIAPRRVVVPWSDDA
ncbi:tRNA pseudouridine(55) synthase TruB [Methylococcus capsulatus]|uniref:tRNA pseudouridine(55) synthase TruB n=1 Tax=Methylococcus capsulatus TaxID=414 RepID=UPI0002F816AA|nr:tRNA pseudouridine(55) synthase TruB [Methylococcus capsulatus]QXP87974.1 tRNA pseudouridine(55) synthase TruB [Methylococcus capsulatus]QXP95014.1 tRNA pseudouridine(55) synthase TruB [Methylococcus capsulatus]UQN12997.1 tRNA pseudouridine(55) synthase TruB [Methylococcus capsulatus]